MSTLVGCDSVENIFRKKNDNSGISTKVLTESETPSDEAEQTSETDSNEKVFPGIPEKNKTGVEDNSNIVQEDTQILTSEDLLISDGLMITVFPAASAPTSGTRVRFIG